MNHNQGPKHSQSRHTLGAQGKPSAAKTSPLAAALLASAAPLVVPIKHWLSSLSQREQVLVKLLGVLFCVFVVWSIAVSPALNSLTKSALKTQTLERQWSELLAIQSELKTIKSVVPVGLGDASSALQELTSQLCPQCKVVIQDTTARMQIKALSPEALTQLLPQIRSRSQAQILETSLRLDNTSKLWEGSMTLALPSVNPASSAPGSN
jgi:general secretion pathway protein M